MKDFIKTLAAAAEVLWVLLTDKEAQRQLDYDNGEGEIEE